MKLGPDPSGEVSRMHRLGLRGSGWQRTYRHLEEARQTRAKLAPSWPTVRDYQGLLFLARQQKTKNILKPNPRESRHTMMHDLLSLQRLLHSKLLQHGNDASPICQRSLGELLVHPPAFAEVLQHGIPSRLASEAVPAEVLLAACRIRLVHWKQYGILRPDGSSKKENEWGHTQFQSPRSIQKKTGSYTTFVHPKP